MKKWAMEWPNVFLLVWVLLLVVLIQVLPQVDLPDTAFQGGTSPIIIHAQYTSAPSTGTISSPVRDAFARNIRERHLQHSPVAIGSTRSILPILYRSLRC